ncbi:hypothetical protein [Pseudomonas akapageensis]|uniref:hypothetical protein n=1 Tax=Pseudomonas akapageensis TaxID=2609961 RepID=UPI00140A0269|nr:hypothetical protein [Pseudomonas akapageensis]
MKFYQEGDHGKALCTHCKKPVTTTFLRRDVPFSDGKGMAKAILVGVCDTCSQVVSIPAQSTPAIRDARQKELIAIDANLPAVYIDMLDMAIHTIDQSGSSQMRKVILAFFFNRLARDTAAKALLQLAHKDAQDRFMEPRGVCRRRLSMKVSPRIANDLNALINNTHMNQTELLKSVIYQIQNDVVASPDPALLKELGELSAIIS